MRGPLGLRGMVASMNSVIPTFKSRPRNLMYEIFKDETGRTPAFLYARLHWLANLRLPSRSCRGRSGGGGGAAGEPKRDPLTVAAWSSRGAAARGCRQGQQPGAGAVARSQGSSQGRGSSQGTGSSQGRGSSQSGGSSQGQPPGAAVGLLNLQLQIIQPLRGSVIRDLGIIGSETNKAKAKACRHTADFNTSVRKRPSPSEL